ncbi:hypothetical protein TPL01_08750 [Sulfuriferula plumbiphila]|uniref:Uncharacterized protein n=1 Tax=Sulfuriferula plumbiphila TaxID=171865 RepID=A0A512L5H9_9PROT|nr:hypothetical protein SFPGR_09140 [Sulfuriferula plumbiphila]GEP29737.1 hypothetical protein TPL01_08750 [Sulfuriferula plumbiphila]
MTALRKNRPDTAQKQRMVGVASALGFPRSRARVAASVYRGLGHLSAGHGCCRWRALSAGLVNTILGTASGARNTGTNGAIAVGG